MMEHIEHEHQGLDTTRIARSAPKQVRTLAVFTCAAGYVVGFGVAGVMVNRVLGWTLVFIGFVLCALVGVAVQAVCRALEAYRRAVLLEAADALRIRYISHDPGIVCGDFKVAIRLVEDMADYEPGFGLVR